MCFLKGRVTDKHTEAHEVVEFSMASKGNKSWFRGNGQARKASVWKEVKAPFVYSPRSSVARCVLWNCDAVCYVGMWCVMWIWDVLLYVGVGVCMSVVCIVVGVWYNTVCEPF